MAVGVACPAGGTVGQSGQNAGGVNHPRVAATTVSSATAAAAADTQTDQRHMTHGIARVPRQKEPARAENALHFPPRASLQPSETRCSRRRRRQ